MATSTDWMSVRKRLASVLYSPAPLAARYEVIRQELEPLQNGYTFFAVRQELKSMARSAADNREAPLLDVGKELLTYCDQELYREVEARGEDPRWIRDLRRHEQEVEDEARRRETDEESF